MFPIYLILSTPICFKFFSDSLLQGKQRSKQLKIFLAENFTCLHLFKVLFVILAFNKTSLVFFSFKIERKFGHISESQILLI